jgi:hypothetical protein
MSKVDWKWLEDQMIEWFKHSHNEGAEFGSDLERLNFIQKVFNEILKVVREDSDEFEKARQYVKQRDEEKNGLEVLTELQAHILEEIQGILKVIENKEARVYAASSFSALTHLSGESDLDFNVLISGLNPEDIIRITQENSKHGFEFTDTRGEIDDPNIHYVFAKYVDVEDFGEVEIEFKLRDMPPYMKTIHLIHDFLDNQADKLDKVAITWIKANLKKSENKDAYAKFKAMYYEWANSHVETDKPMLMYPIKSY